MTTERSDHPDSPPGSAASTDAPQPGAEADGGSQHELRLALALRGGASMAVWIGGAVAEVERLRRALGSNSDHHDNPQHPWSALAGLSGYDAVSVDVLAGTSAGGLNAALLSASIIYGFPFDSSRETWIRLADLEAMCRAIPKLWESAPESLLEGDDYFRAELCRTLEQGIPRQPGEHKLGERLDLLLTATLLDPVLERHLDASLEPVVEEQRTAHFRFHHLGRPGDPFSDFAEGDGPDSGVLRLAHAARSTSSFPFAFEPARVYSGAAPPPAGEPDMLGLFSATQEAGDAGPVSPESPDAVPARVRDDPVSPRRVMDGGVLDNIPVTAAIDAIAAAPADRPTRRWLLYFNPEPGTTAPDPAPWRRLPLPVTSSALRAKMGQETLLADIGQLEEHNAAVDRAAQQRASLLAPLLRAAPGERPQRLTEIAEAHFAEHAVIRAQLDAANAAALLADPAGSEDGHLLPPVVGDPLAGWDERVRAVLPRHISDRLSQRAGEFPDEMFADVRALLSGVDECLGWAQALNDTYSAVSGGDQDTVEEIGRVKAALYRLKIAAEVLSGHTDRWWLTAAQQWPRAEVAELNSWVDAVLERRRRTQHRLPEAVRPALQAVLERVRSAEGLGDPDFQRRLADFAEQLETTVDSVADGEGSGTVDAVTEANAVLLELAERLAVIRPDDNWQGHPTTLAYDLLTRASGQRRLAVLHELVVLAAPLATGRATGARIDFLRVGGNAQTPLPFDALRDRDEPLRAEDKLRGTDLNHFGAFASARWRANDWMWGRLDSVTTLVRMLTDPERLRARNIERGADALFADVRGIVCEPTRADLGEVDEQRLEQWREFFVQCWHPRAEQVRAEIDALFDQPEADHPLTATRTVLTERLHWAIAAREVPFVNNTALGAETRVPARPPGMAPKQLAGAVRSYDVGRQRLADLGEERTGGMATRLGLIALRAARPRRSGVPATLVRLGISAVKPLALLAFLAAAAPRRVTTAVWVALLGLLCTGWGGSDIPRHYANYEGVWLFPFPVSPAPGVVPRVPAGFGDVPAVLDFNGTGWDVARLLVTVAFLGVSALLGWLQSGKVGAGGSHSDSADSASRTVQTAVAVGSGVAGLVAAVVAMLIDLRLGVLGVAVLSGALTWALCFAYRQAPRLAAAVLSLVVYAVLALIFAAVGWTPGWWLVVATGVAGYGQMLLAGSVDVLPPRPRRPHSTTGSGSPASGDARSTARAS